MTFDQPFQSEHLFIYATKKPISATMLAESLVGLDGIVDHSARVLAAIMEVRVKSSGVLIKKIEFGSYKEDIIVRLLFGKGKDLEKNIEKLRKLTGLTHMSAGTLITLVLICVLGYGVYKFAADKGDQKATISITNSFNDWGKEVGMTGEELMAKVATAITDHGDLKKQVVRLTRPAGADDNGSITFDGSPARKLDAEVVSVVPLQYEKELPDEPVKDFPNEQIVIRAADLDRPSTGWFGIAPGISDRRVAVQLEEGVDPMKIILGKYNQADITVLYELDKRGEKFPKKFLVRKIYDSSGK